MIFEAQSLPRRDLRRWLDLDVRSITRQASKQSFMAVNPPQNLQASRYFPLFLLGWKTCSLGILYRIQHRFSGLVHCFASRLRTLQHFSPQLAPPPSQVGIPTSTPIRCRHSIYHAWARSVSQAHPAQCITRSHSRSLSDPLLPC